jgi:hypothetical protein
LPAVREKARVSLRRNEKRHDEEPEPEPALRADCEAAPSSPLGPFVLGTVVGGLAGAVLGTALSPHTRGFLIGLYHLLNRRLTSAERDQLRFELLLQ